MNVAAALRAHGLRSVLGLTIIVLVAAAVFAAPSLAAKKAALTDVTLSPTSFYAGSGSTTLKYTLTRGATVSVWARNAGGTTVRTLLSSKAQAGGSYSVTWDGTGTGGASLPAGSYSVVVSATTSAGTEQSVKAVQLVTPVLNSVAASPTSFYAGTGSSTLTYALTGPATVTASVLNGNGSTVRTLQPATAQAAGFYVLTWDGKADGGSSLPAGSYSLVVSAKTSAGTEQSVKAVQLVPPVLTSVAVSPAAFYVGSGSSTLTYTLTGPADVSVEVRDGNGSTVRTLQPATAQTAGSYSSPWDGKADGGSSLPAGNYSLVVTATTSVGTLTSSQAVQLVTPVLNSVAASPTSFYGGAGASGSTTVTYTLAGPATVVVSALDAAGAKVATVQPSTSLGAGSYSVTWDGTRTAGSSLPAGAYSLVVSATTAAGTEQRTQTVQYTPTPVASEASLALDAAGGYVLHTVAENWSETLNGQTSANYYYDAKAQPWEYAATSGVTVTLFVSANPVSQEDTTAGGSVTGTTDAKGVADLAFPSGLAWYDANGSPLPLYYSLKVTYGGSSRWYPAAGRYRLHAPVGADGHLQFAFMSDIQTPSSGSPSPNLPPSSLTSATGPYTAIPDLSRSLGWATVLAGLRQESATNVVLCGGDPIERGSNVGAPDDGATQWRTLLDNQQSYGAGDEWSLSSLAGTVPVEIALGNHDDLGATGTTSLWNRWVYSPNQQYYYSFDRGDVHFVVLNTYSTSYSGYIGFQSATSGGSRTALGTTYTNSGQANWLISAIDTNKPWTVVVTHYPLFDSYKGQPYADKAQTTLTTTNARYYGERNRLLALFAAHGVDVVLQGHVHNFRHHVEKVRSADGGVTSAMTFITDGLAGGPPVSMADPSNGPLIDWVDLDADGVPDANEPVATADNSPYWDASAFGQQNSPVGASGYTGASDMFHAPGEYNNGLTFSYTMFQTGSDAQGAPALAMTVKFISWNSTTRAWDPWRVYDSAQIPQVSPGMVATRLAAN